MYDQDFWQSMGQSDMIANPVCGHLNKQNVFSMSPFAPENLVTGSAVPSYASSPILPTKAESGAYSWDFSRFSRRLPHIPSTAMASIPSYSAGHAITYRWYLLPRVRRHRASSPRGSCSNG